MKFGSVELYLIKHIIAFFAFCDKENKQETLVLTTQGIIKKQIKYQEKNEKAQQIRLKYFEQKHELQLEIVGEMIRKVRLEET